MTVWVPLSLDLKVDDFIAYYVHMLRTSEAIRKQMRRVQLLASLMVLLALVFAFLRVALRLTGATLVPVACGIAFLVWIVLFPRYARGRPPNRSGDSLPTGSSPLPRRRACGSMRTAASSNSGRTVRPRTPLRDHGHRGDA